MKQRPAPPSPGPNAEMAMDLLLWRHAEAEEGSDDLQRRLTGRGEKQARAVARWLGPLLPPRLRIVASAAARAQQTAMALGLPFETDHQLGPSASVSDIIAVTAWPMAGGAVLVVGHQPYLGRLASLLLAGQEADWTIKKGALWWFSHRVRAGQTQTILKAAIPPDFC